MFEQKGIPVWGLFIVAAFSIHSAECLGQGKQITPTSIRVEPLNKEEKGGWITLGGYLEIGSPCISPDNKWVAFDARELGFGKSPGEIWIAQRDGSNMQKLVNGETPRWSPDSKQVLFSRENADGVPFVRLINADGTGEKEVCEGRWPEWSPDGSKIAFSKGGKSMGGARELALIYIAKKDGTEPELIAAGDCPSWSPDGKMIACCYRDPALPGPMIRVVELQTNKERFVGLAFYRANWTADNKELLANGPTAIGQFGLVRMNALKQAAAQPVPTAYENPASPHQSRDGSYNVFVAQRPANQ